MDRPEGLTQEMIDKLGELLDPELVATRWDGAKYLEGYVVIAQANEIFGYGNWGYRVVEESENSVGCKATVEFWLFGQLVCRDRGFVEFPFAKDHFGEMTGAIYDTAYKGCVTDGMKRCMRIMGPQFGNSLYEKDSTPPKQPASQPPHPMASGPPPPQQPPDDPYTGKSDEPARQGGSVCACGGTIGQKSDGTYFEACWKCNNQGRRGGG